MNRRKTIIRITTISVLIALAAVLSIFDRYISMAIFTAIPFAGAIIPATFKLGIANIVILIIIYNYNFKTGFVAILLKSVIISLFSIVSFATTFFIGFTGTFLSFLIMSILKKGLKSKKTMIFVSAVGGLTHGFGQLIANGVLYLVGSGVASLGSLLIMAPSVLILGIITGIIIGFVSYKINQVLIKQKIIINQENNNLNE